MSYIDLPQANLWPEYANWEAQKWTLAETLARTCEMLGAKYAFGVSGGEIGPVWEALEYSNLETLHFRQETHAAFAACEYSMAADEPVVVFATGGPGIANCMNGLIASKLEGAQIIFLAPYSDANKRGKFAVQESSHDHFPSNLLLSSSVFDFSMLIESPEQLPTVISRASNTLSTGGSGIIGLFISQNLQKSICPPTSLSLREAPLKIACPDEVIADCAKQIAGKKLLIWAGFGARKYPELLRRLAEKTGALVMCSPRGKGVFPEKHPQFIGVTGLGGQQSLYHRLEEFQPDRCLILGTRLAEPTSFWNPGLVPSKELIHVDINPKVFGVAYPERRTHAVLADIGYFLEQLTPLLPEHAAPELEVPPNMLPEAEQGAALSPRTVMDAIQTEIDRDHQLPVIAEAGNSFVWANNLLKFARPNYRISTAHGSMGHAVAGVLGLSLAREKQKAIAIVGDGAMLMSGGEISTAVKYQINALWIVLNDSSYNMCRQGTSLQGMKQMDCEIPPTNFVTFAESMGAIGYRVETEEELRSGIEKGMKSELPCVLDVIIDREIPAPIEARVFSLKAK